MTQGATLGAPPTAKIPVLRWTITFCPLGQRQNLDILCISWDPVVCNPCMGWTWKGEDTSSKPVYLWQKASSFSDISEGPNILEQWPWGKREQQSGFLPKEAELPQHIGRKIQAVFGSFDSSHAYTPSALTPVQSEGNVMQETLSSLSIGLLVLGHSSAWLNLLAMWHYHAHHLTSGSFQEQEVYTFPSK